jgi:hypothetical protein
MADKRTSMLARLMAGYEQPFTGPRNDAALPPFEAPGSMMGSFAPPVQRAGLPAYQQPFMGARNTPAGLPPYEQPGGSLPMDRYMQAPTPAPVPAAPMPAPQMAPEPLQTGGQGYAGPDPMLPAPYDPMKDPRYLPEQWAGAFNRRWQS